VETGEIIVLRTGREWIGKQIAITAKLVRIVGRIIVEIVIHAFNVGHADENLRPAVTIKIVDLGDGNNALGRTELQREAGAHRKSGAAIGRAYAVEVYLTAEFAAGHAIDQECRAHVSGL